MGTKRKHILRDGGASIHPSEVLLRSNNLVRWTNPQNGAEIINDWNGENTIAVLGYGFNDYGGGSFSTAKTCDLEFLADVGPTASGNCSASRMTWQTGPTANQYIPSQPKTTPPAGLLKFLNDGYSIGDGQPKPSNLHILLSVWFEYDQVVPRPFPYPFDEENSIWYIGVGAAGVGTGDLMELAFQNGDSQTFFTDTNHFETSGPPPPVIPKATPETTDWSDHNPHVTWIIQGFEGRQNFRVRIVGPQYIQGSPSGSPQTAYFFAPPAGIRYYVHAQAIYGCTGFAEIAPIPSTVQLRADQPRIQKLNRHYPRG